MRCPEPFPCPVCGEEVPRNAKSCPECGACEKSGWSGDTAHDALDLPDESFDYDAFVAEEFGGGKPRKSGAQWFWWAISVVVLLAFVLLLLRR